MKNIKVIKLVNATTNEILGYAPVLDEKGRRYKMMIENNEPLKFKTRKEARDYEFKP